MGDTMEIWKDIAGYEGQYQVSSLGRVKSLSRPQSRTERFLKFDVSKKINTNYFRVTLATNNQTKRVFVHRLVASAFIENKDNLPYVNHIDNNGENNNIENLEWCSHSGNMIHAQIQGRLHEAQSKGGKIASKVAKDKARATHESNIGKVYGDWTFLEIAKEEGNWKGLFRCVCGLEKEVNISTVTSGTSRNCRSCGLKRSHRERKIKI